MEPTDVIEIRVPRTLFGAGAIDGLGDLVRSLGAARVLLVTDPGVVAAGLVETVKAALDSAGMRADLFDECGAEAPASIIERLAEKARTAKYDLLVGLGGGSVMDTTKAAALLAVDEAVTVRDLIEGKGPAKGLAKVLIPTTAGTGSEWSTAAVVTTDATDDRTYTYLTAANYPDAVIIDPALTLRLPPKNTADTGIDALTHAIEAYTCIRANLLSDMYASTAIRLVSSSLGPAFAKGSQRMGDRYRMAIGAAMAMQAGTLAGVGLAHFMNHALGKRAHISHGSTVGLMLPYVMEYNLISSPERFAEVARLMGENTEGLSTMDAAHRSVTAVRRLLTDLGMPQRLSEVGLTEADVPHLVEELVTLQVFPITLMNPRDIGAEEAGDIYMRAL
jgi:alcohol dehydrogenase class IV